MLCIIGGGKVGWALAKGFLDRPDHDALTIVERNATRQNELKSMIAASSYLHVTISDEAVPCYGAVVAVKPKDVDIAVSDAVKAGAKRILSVAAGISLARLHEWAGPGVPVIRSMPNIGAMVGQSATAIAAGPATHEDDMSWAEGVLKTVGSVVRVGESSMDAITGLSGSGPAYFLLMTEALIDGGVHAGLTPDISRELTVATIRGVAELLASDPDADPAKLRASVTTPAGTTAAGLRVLERAGVRATLMDAVEAAAKRSHELNEPGK